MNKFLLALIAFAVGGALAYYVVANQTTTKMDPSEDPANAIVKPEKVHPVTPDMEEKLTPVIGKAMYPGAFQKTDGAEMKLAKLGSKPILLYFIQKECPCCVKAQPAIDALATGFGDAVKVVGITDADSAKAKEWVTKNSPKFEVVADPKLAGIHYYNAERATYMVLIDPKGNVVAAYPGYNKQIISEVADKLASLAKIETPKIDVSDLPDKKTSGCLYAMEMK